MQDSLAHGQGYSHVIVQGQATAGSVGAVEAVLQVDPGLPDDVVCPHQIVVHHPDDQLRVQREGHGEFKHPGGQSAHGQSGGPQRSGGGVPSGTDSPKVGFSCLGM